jgi:hypothetical protein
MREFCHPETWPRSVAQRGEALTLLKQSRHHPQPLQRPFMSTTLPLSLLPDPRLAQLSARMPVVDAYTRQFATLQARWDTLALLGHLSELRMDTRETSDAFATLAAEMVRQLSIETFQRTTSQLEQKATAALDVLTRNLFERTADIGFLAMDEDVVAFCEQVCAGTEPDAEALRARFRQYVAKYSVYRDVVLLDPEGRIVASLQPAVVTRSGSAVVGRALASGSYVESFEPLDFAPGDHALSYASRVGPPARPLGVLVLVFDVHTEAPTIFGPLATHDEVLVFIDADDTVLLSSDPWVVPVGLRVPPRDDSRQLKLAGRRMLVAEARPQSYQGYGGPGWSALCVVPVEEAFPAMEAADRIELSGEGLFSPELLSIPAKAQQIRARLQHLVWNGRVQQSVTNDRFSRALLREIAAVGASTQAVFDASIANLQAMAVATIQGEAQAAAARAVNLLDRNLYERACDCRWWAQAPTLRSMAPQASARVLADINALYTVYTDILLFDARGRIVAASADASVVGTTLDAGFVARTLKCPDNGYAVSPFEVTALYGGRPTYLYGAPLRQDGRADGAALGGVALVFDALPQFQAMLEATRPAFAGTVCQFRRPDGIVVGRTGELPFKMPAAWAAAWAALRPGQSHAMVLEADGQFYAVGVAMGAGYREFKNSDGYVEPVMAMVAIPCGPRVATRPADELRATDSTAANSLEVATFKAGGSWWAAPASQVVEFAELKQLLSVPGQHGANNMALHGDTVVRTLRLPGSPKGGRDAVVLGRGPQQLAVFVEALGPVLRAEMVEMDIATRRGQTLATGNRLVKVGADLLQLIEPEKLVQGLQQ